MDALLHFGSVHIKPLTALDEITQPCAELHVLIFASQPVMGKKIHRLIIDGFLQTGFNLPLKLTRHVTRPVVKLGLRLPL